MIDKNNKFNQNSEILIKKENKVIKFLKNNAFFIVLGALLLVYTLSMLLVFSFGIINSFKSADEYGWNQAKLPTEGWQIKNYITALAELYVKVKMLDGSLVLFGLLDMYLNTILYAVGCGFLSTLVPCFTAYLTARFNYKFSGFIVGIVIVTMSLPIVGSTPSSLQLARSLGLYNKIWGLWIMSAHFQMGLHFLVFHEAFKAFPEAYKEAAEIDGANNFQVMLQILMPLVRNVFFTVFLLRVIGYWNEYQTALLYMPSSPTVAYGLYVFTFANTDNTLCNVPMKLTCAYLVAIPIFVVFCIFQNRIMSNLSIGGIKG